MKSDSNEMKKKRGDDTNPVKTQDKRRKVAIVVLMRQVGC
jgi:hypothetical protein